MALKFKFSFLAVLLFSLLDRLFYIIYVDKHLLLIRLLAGSNEVPAGDVRTANSKKMTISEQSEQLEFSYATSAKSEHGTVLNKKFLLLQ